MRPLTTLASTSVHGPWQIAATGFPLLDERAHEADRVLVGAQEVRVCHAARQHEAVVGIGVGLRHRPVDAERVALVEVVEALDLAGLERQQSGCPPSCSTFFQGSLSSICSTPFVARNATFLPSSRFAITSSGSWGASGPNERLGLKSLSTSAAGLLAGADCAVHVAVPHRVYSAPAQWSGPIGSWSGPGRSLSRRRWALGRASSRAFTPPPPRVARRGLSPSPPARRSGGERAHGSQRGLLGGEPAELAPAGPRGSRGARRVPPGGELSKVRRWGPMSHAPWPDRRLGSPEGLLVDGCALGHRPERHPSRELDRGSRGAAGRRRSSRRGSERWDDGALAARIRAVRVHGHAIVTVGDAAHRRSEHQPPLAERLRHPDRQELGAADEAILLCAALGLEQQVEAAGRVNVEEDVEQRHLVAAPLVTASIPSSRIMRPGLVRRLRRSQVPAVWESSFSRRWLLPGA